MVKSESSRTALAPRRSNGRERVSGILEAAAQVIRERGFDATTMKEIADRSETNMGSLYRFFPNKEALGEALIQRYDEKVDAEFDRIHAMAATIPISDLADALIDFMVVINDEATALIALLESRSEWTAKRKDFREKTLSHIAKTVRMRAPDLDQTTLEGMAVVLLNNMKAMASVTLDPIAATSPGAANELRAMNRLYLASRCGDGPGAL